MSDKPNAIDPAFFNQETEQATLSSVLIAPELVATLRAFLAPDDFFLLRHQYIWQAMLSLDDAGEPLDMVTISEALETHGLLEKIGGRVYLVQLLNTLGTSVNGEAYARIIERLSMKRKAWEAAAKLQKGITDGKETTPDIIAGTVNELMEVGVSSSMRLTPISEAVARHMDKVEARQQNPNGMIGIPSGYKLFDVVMKGFQQDRLYVWGGATGMGKSAWMMNIALRMAENGYRVGWFSYENTEHESVTRMASIEGGIDNNHIESGTMSREEYRAYNDAMGKIGNYPLFITEDMTLTPTQLRALCRKQKYQHGLDVVFVDYIQIIPSGMGNMHREAEVAYITWQLKLIAKELHIPVITAAQVNRNPMNRSNQKPAIGDMRESAAIEHTADVVGFVHFPAYYLHSSDNDDERATFSSNNWNGFVSVVKHRNGPTGEFDMHYTRNQLRFNELIE